ncbi:MAG: 4Fe-4S dicluster domain-containing protein [Deltaproteobacteria bacterium]|nr:4Fe-4S dicluster domain-containing protein [Deltaproteobacteria bacterium]
MTLSRRKFLKTTAAAALTAMAIPKAGQGFELEGRMSPGPKALKAKRWGMVVDMRRCKDDCAGACIKACHAVHNVPYIPQAEHQVMWLFLEPYENAFPEQSRGLTAGTAIKQKFLLMCNHCEDPPCVRACPTQATFKRQDDGIVMMDYHRCIGCRFCMAACPYGSRSFNFRDPRPFISSINPGYPTRRKGVVEKCNFCQERLEIGQMPACVEVCKEGVLTFRDLRDPDSTVSKILAKHPHMRRKPDLGTGPSVYYVL